MLPPFVFSEMKDLLTSSRPPLFTSPGDGYRQGSIVPTPTSTLDLPLEGSEIDIYAKAWGLSWGIQHFFGSDPITRIMSSPFRPREDSNSQPQAIANDSSLHKPMKVPCSRASSTNPLVNYKPGFATWDPALASYEYDLHDSAAFDIDGSHSNGGRARSPGDGSSGSWSSEAASSMRSASTRRGHSHRFASPTPSTHKPKDCNPSDDISDGDNPPCQQWDPSLGLERSSPASCHPPIVAPVKTPSWLSGKPDGIDSDVSVRPPLNYPSALSNPMGRSDTRSRGCKGGDSLLSKNKQFLPDFALPDLTRVIHNKTFVASGGYSLVFRADGKKSQGSSTKVAVKILRIPRQENERGYKILKRLKREARVWKSLNHPNIVPLLGVVSGKLGPGLVSPWYSQGNVLQYIRRVPNVRREALCEDVASGLRYLHEQDPPIVHGDLKGDNILIGMDGHAALCDFGLAVILDGGPTGFTSSAVGGTIRFMAKEQLDDNGSRSPLSDIYAYACTYAQIMTGDPPFIWYKTSPLIIRAICEGESPYKIGTIISQHNVEFLGLSWDPEPACRPTIADICQILGMLQPVEDI